MGEAHRNDDKVGALYGSLDDMVLIFCGTLHSTEPGMSKT
jgi:hypothetical protein